MPKLSSTVPWAVVIDDDPSVLKALARLVRSAGYEVQPYATPHACLKDGGQAWPWCYIIDVQMPKMDGFELVDCLRQKGCQSPVIFITAHDSLHARIAAAQHGVIGLVLKPFDDAALLAALSKVMESPGNPSY